MVCRILVFMWSLGPYQYSDEVALSCGVRVWRAENASELRDLLLMKEILHDVMYQNCRDYSNI